MSSVLVILGVVIVALMFVMWLEIGTDRPELVKPQPKRRLKSTFTPHAPQCTWPTTRWKPATSRSAEDWNVPDNEEKAKIAAAEAEKLKADDPCPECGQLFALSDDYLCPSCRAKMN